MMPRFRVMVLGAILIAGATVVRGQTTADGVAALARGDYARAAEILRPIAESWRQSDTAAQYFMATLYDSGQGVSADPLRACALYLRASANRENPFGAEADRLVGASIRSPFHSGRSTTSRSI